MIARHNCKKAKTILRSYYTGSAASKCVLIGKGSLQDNEKKANPINGAEKVVSTNGFASRLRRERRGRRKGSETGAANALDAG